MLPLARPPRFALAHALLVGAVVATGAAQAQQTQPAPTPPAEGPPAQPAPSQPAPSQPAAPAQATGDPPPQNPNVGGGDASLQDARRAYDEGSTHYVAGRYREALIAFERAYSLRPNPVVLLPILECHDHLGHIPEAIQTLETYLAAVPGGRNRPLLESRLANLRQRPARVHILTTPPGARIEIDGAEVAQRSPTYVELPAGRHTVVVTAPGHLSTSHEFETQPGTPRDEILTLEVDPAAQTTPAGPTVGARGPASRTTSPVVWVAAGLAGVGLVVGTTFGVLALSDNNLYDADPTQETRDRGLRYALLSDVSFGVAAASGALALIVYFVERSRTPPEPRVTAAPSARLRLLPGGVHLEF